MILTNLQLPAMTDAVRSFALLVFHQLYVLYWIDTFWLCEKIEMVFSKSNQHHNKLYPYHEIHWHTKYNKLCKKDLRVQYRIMSVYNGIWIRWRVYTSKHCVNHEKYKFARKSNSFPLTNVYFLCLVLLLKKYLDDIKTNQQTSMTCCLHSKYVERYKRKFAFNRTNFVMNLPIIKLQINKTIWDIGLYYNFNFKVIYYMPTHIWNIIIILKCFYKSL